MINEYKYIIGRIDVPEVQYKKKIPIGKDNELTTKYSATIGKMEKISNGISFPCKIEANIDSGNFSAEITVASTIGIEGLLENPSHDIWQDITPKMMRPLMSKIAEVFAFLSGNDNPFPIILPSQINMKKVTVKKEDNESNGK